MGKSLIFLTIFLPASLHAMQLIHGKARFVFDPETQRCLNAQHEEGLNSFEPGVIFQGMSPLHANVRWPARDAQCTDFSNVKFHRYLGANYSVLVGWDFRGSHFTHAELSFNFIQDGLFAGSTIEELKIGYGRVTARDIAFNKGDMPAR